MNTALLETALEGETFSVDGYQLDVPEIDGRVARNLTLRFAGNAKLDPTSGDDVALLQAARMGHEIRLIVVGTVAQKSFSLDVKGVEMGFSLAVRVERVEAGELV